MGEPPAKAGSIAQVEIGDTHNGHFCFAVQSVGKDFLKISGH
jgi:hypothetical protein